MTAEEVLEMWDDIEGDVADPEGSEGIRKSIQCGVIPTLFACFLWIPSLYVISFLKCFFVTCFACCFFLRERVW